MSIDLPVIEPGNLYPIKTARALMGWETPAAWRAARQLGMKDRIRFVGKRGYLKGSDLIEFVEEVGKPRQYPAHLET